MRKSWRSSVVAAVASTIVVGASADLRAHRRDEYLQAARIALDPERVRIELDLTAGMAVADLVLADIDRDRTGTVSAGEAAHYAAVVREAVRVEIDGRPLSLELLNNRFPSVASVRQGEGIIRLELVARLPPLSAGTHQLSYRNSHRAGIGVYLANVLVPDSPRISVGAQRRDVDQRELIVEYVLDGGRPTGARSWFFPVVTGALLGFAALWWRRTMPSLR